jgi:hypothetical protein
MQINQGFFSSIGWTAFFVPVENSTCDAPLLAGLLAIAGEVLIEDTAIASGSGRCLGCTCA